MNTDYLKYFIEVARTKSINKAAENLFISQPNLSRTIKKLEEEVGLTLFERTQNGIELTFVGKEFLIHAKEVVDELDKISNINVGSPGEQKFSISVPKAAYISRTFTSFISMLDMNNDVSVDYKESSSIGAIDNILLYNFNLGIIRYEANLEGYYKLLLRERGLDSRELTRFKFLVAFSQNDPLAYKETITTKDFDHYIELTHGESYLPYFTKNLTNDVFNTNKKIRIYDSMGQLAMLNKIKNSFMLVYPLSEDVLEKYGLVQRHIEDFDALVYDVLIFKKNYIFSNLDILFVNEIEKSLKK